MIKLMDASGKCAWIYGTKSISYKNKAMAISGIKKNGQELQNIIKAMAMQALESTILAGYNILYSIENGHDVNRQDVIVNIKLPACISDAIKVILATQKTYSLEF